MLLGINLYINKINRQWAQSTEPTAWEDKGGGSSSLSPMLATLLHLMAISDILIEALLQETVSQGFITHFHHSCTGHAAY